MKAIALICGRCGGHLLVSPGVGLGVCNPCSAAWDFSAGEKREIELKEPILPAEAVEEEVLRLPFITFEATGGGNAGRVFVMAFGLSKIGTPHDDGSKLTVDGFEGEMGRGSLDRPPDLTVSTAAGLARFLALRRLDPDGRRRLRPTDVRLSAPAVIAVPFGVRRDTLHDPITGLVLERSLVG